MKQFQMHPDPTAEEAAALWAARLEGSALDAQGRAELGAWLAGDSSRLPLLEHYCQLSIDLEELLPELVAAGRVEIPAGIEPARRRRGARWIAAGALAAAALAAAVVWMGRAGGPPETIATRLAERRTFTLADGTRVE